MTDRLLTFFFVATMTFGCSPSQPSETNETKGDEGKYSLKDDLHRYNGFYTSVESSGGQISRDNLPPDILGFKSLVVESVTVEYLTKSKDGYLLTFCVNYKGAKTLVVSTLNSEYFLVDYRIFTNGLGSKDVTQDTIAVPSYHENGVTVVIMHPNRIEEPEFEVDGIRKEELVIGDDLKLINTR
jgi:hypothetical protein